MDQILATHAALCTKGIARVLSEMQNLRPHPGLSESEPAF